MRDVEEDLLQRHFVQQGERPPHLAEVELPALDPALRGLLLTDGTVTRALEAQELRRVTVEVVSQGDVPLTGRLAEQLEANEGTGAVRRLVEIGTAGREEPLIRAESYILPKRLPSGFLGVLQEAPDGIGESLQQVKLESWREMLWLGFDSAPEWLGESQRGRPVITRRYRVITAENPALLISESFAVELRDGAFGLGWLS